MIGTTPQAAALPELSNARESGRVAAQPQRLQPQRPCFGGKRRTRAEARERLTGAGILFCLGMRGVGQGRRAGAPGRREVAWAAVSRPVGRVHTTSGSHRHFLLCIAKENVPTRFRSLPRQAGLPREGGFVCVAASSQATTRRRTCYDFDAPERKRSAVQNRQRQFIANSVSG